MQRHTLLFTLLLLLIVLAACGRGATKVEPPQIHYGETECAECRMIINDPRFAAAYTYELTQGRYESVSFDDIGDMLIHAEKHPEHTIVAFWVHDFKTEEWIDAKEAHFVYSPYLETPMAQGTAAVQTREQAELLADEYQGQILEWDGLWAKQRDGELVVSLVHQAKMGYHSHHDLMDPETPFVLGEADAVGYHIKLMSHGPLQAGYNPLMLQIADPTGTTLTQAEVAFWPLMHMPEMVHGAPVEQPEAIAHPDGHFAGGVGFPMPSGPDLGEWELGVAFDDLSRGAHGEVTFPITVAPCKLVGSFIARDDESKLFLMVVSPQAPSVGQQPLEILAVQKTGAMAWPPVDGLTLEITPKMPTMGHGSPHNQDPVSVGQGHYQGEVNFSMAGFWTVAVEVTRGGVVIGEVVFEFDVE
jgi:copper chaperone NosL